MTDNLINARLLNAATNYTDQKVEELKSEFETKLVLERVEPVVIEGPPGPPGPSSVQVIEARGEQGERGESGPAGAAVNDAILTDGHLHLVFEDGRTVELGEVVGPRGGRGDPGPTGLVGPTGPIGPQGVQGDRGYIGSMGPKGIRGDKGEIGSDGETGPIGPQGEQGISGEQGPTGKDGTQGPIGTTGPMGLTGKDGQNVDPSELKAATKEIKDNLEEQFNAQMSQYQAAVSTRIQNLAGAGGGSGSYSIVDMRDVEFTQLSALANNTVLVFDNTISKFKAFPLSTIINNIRADLEMQYNKQIDVAGVITYVGEALPGSITSAASWRIKKIDETASPDTTITWADGDENFDNIWDNRAGLSYS